MTRRAFLSFKSNTGAREIQIKHASQEFQELGQKNEDCSKSVSSFDSGAIFRPSLGQDLSRNVFVVSIYAFEKNSYGRMCSGMSAKIFVRATFYRETHIVRHCIENHIGNLRQVACATFHRENHIPRHCTKDRIDH